MPNASVGFPSVEDDNTDQDEIATLPAPPDLEDSAITKSSAQAEEPVSIPRPSDIRRIIRELAERVDEETKRR